MIDTHVKTKKKKQKQHQKVVECAEGNERPNVFNALANTLTPHIKDISLIYT